MFLSTPPHHPVLCFFIQGRGAHLTAVPIQCPDSPKFQRHNRTFSQPHNDQQQQPLQVYTNTSLHSRSNSESDCNHSVFSKNLAKFQQGEQQQQKVVGAMQNGCLSSRENLLAKTDVAMASLLVRLDQVAAQCSAAQIHGGGRLICEEKFQVYFHLQSKMHYFKTAISSLEINFVSFCALVYPVFGVQR